MASSKIGYSNKIGNMTVITTDVATKELYISVVMRGEEVFDIEPATTPDDARFNHDKFVTMCQVFDPVIDKAIARKESGGAIDVDSLIQEIDNNFHMMQTAKRGMIH